MVPQSWLCPQIVLETFLQRLQVRQPIEHVIQEHLKPPVRVCQLLDQA